VLAVQAEWRQKLEAQPTRFMSAVVPGALRDAAARLDAFVNADGKTIAFVENATQGCNAVLRSLRLRAGDEIVVLSHAYGAVRNAVRFVCERAGARMVEAKIPFPRPHPDAIVANLEAALTPRTRLAVLDHITSGSALVLPLKRMVEVCHAAGVPVLVDGAHGPGQVALDLTALNAEWYVGNCHKWLNAPKGCGFLHARADCQDDLHPVTISHGYGKGFCAEFDWTGTWDPSAFLCVTDAIAFHERLGGEAMRARNIALAAEGSTLIAGRLGTETGAGNELSGSMGVVRLPLQGEVTREGGEALRRRLLEAGTDAPVHLQAGALWLRISAAAYNERDDYVKLATLVTKVLADEG
jgi:isopenicillin-N epimerase